MSSEDYELCRRGLALLQRLTDILPSIKKLDGEVVREGSRPVESGSHSQIWKGLWLNELHVGLYQLLPSSRATGYWIAFRWR